MEDKPKSEHEEEKTTSKKPRPEKLMIIGGLRSYRERETRGCSDCGRLTAQNYYKYTSFRIRVSTVNGTVTVVVVVVV